MGLNWSQGLNWSEGLGGAAAGFARASDQAFRKEMMEAEAARFENLERLRQKNQLERDSQNFAQTEQTQTRMDNRTDARIKGQDDRAAKREEARDGRAYRNSRAAEGRADAREDKSMERDERRYVENRVKDYRTGLERANRDIFDANKALGDILGADSAYATAAAMGDESAMSQAQSRVLKSNPAAKGFVTSLQEADRRRAALEVDYEQAQQHAQPNMGALIPRPADPLPRASSAPASGSPLIPGETAQRYRNSMGFDPKAAR